MKHFLENETVSINKRVDLTLVPLLLLLDLIFVFFGRGNALSIETKSQGILKSDVCGNYVRVLRWPGPLAKFFMTSLTK